VNSLPYLLRPQDLPTWHQRLALRMLNAIGWRMRFKPLPGPHGVVIYYPHTSNWDVVIGLLGKWALNIPFKWLVKEKLFQGVAGATVGRLLKHFGAVAVERGTSTGATERLAQKMNESDWFWLALAPEGTRSYKPYWRSGFYHIALAARVPLLIVWVDYPNKELGVCEYVELTGDRETDLAAIRAAYDGHHGLYPKLEGPIELAPPR
jgi:1-acyl-sn-glycerol-3-phosphate acyltransferase